VASGHAVAAPLSIDDKLELARLYDRQVGGLYFPNLRQNGAENTSQKNNPEHE
jgi:hypothetical protein